jgi:carbamate kinase
MISTPIRHNDPEIVDIVVTNIDFPFQNQQRMIQTFYTESKEEQKNDKEQANMKQLFSISLDTKVSTTIHFS